ncbi:MAG: hypothetical protein ACXW3B_07770 [Telluria sp.]
MRTMLPAALALALLLTTPAQAQDIQPARRDGTPSEIDSFNAFYRGLAPQQPGAGPVVSATRQPGQRAWKLEASVDGAPYRGAGALCRMTRGLYAYDASAPKQRRWSAAGQKRFAWVDRATCTKPARLVELMQRIPDAELIPLIEQHGVLLLRSRLLFSGNTSCAPHRSLRFRLVAIDVSAPPHGREELHALVFDNALPARANVWIKKRGAELNAWDVACAQGTPAAR